MIPTSHFTPAIFVYTYISSLDNVILCLTTPLRQVTLKFTIWGMRAHLVLLLQLPDEDRTSASGIEGVDMFALQEVLSAKEDFLMCDSAALHLVLGITLSF